MDLDTISLQDSGVRKAAILVAGLDENAAEALLSRLDPERAALIRQAAACLDDVDPAERRQVFDEFRRIGPLIPSRSPSGIELDKVTNVGDACRGWGRETPNNRQTFSTRDAAKETPFGFLCEAEEEKLARLLADERPPTVALVLAHLPPERAGEVLARLPSALQVEIVRRLADLDNADADTLREVERAIEARWSKQFAAEPRLAAGPDAVARILAACDGKLRGRILDNLAARDRALAERFGDRPMAFDELERFDDSTLAAVFRAAAPEVAFAALLGAPHALVERVLRQLPAPEARQWRRRLEHPEPTRLSDVEEARRRIADLARGMAREKTAFAA